MTTDDLRALALAATPGPWRLVPPDPTEAPMWSICEPDEKAFGSIADCYNYADAQDEANATYIAALSPERVLAMIAVIEKAKAMRERCRYEVAGQLRGAACAFDAALAELEGMK